jgi:hypothetical protein
MLLVVIKVSSIEDTTQKELREIESTGTLSAGEKSLADLRKRKLAVQKFGNSVLSILTFNVDLHVGKANGSLSTKDKISAPRPQSRRLISQWKC